MNAQPDWSDLRVFLEVVRHGSLNRAAAALGVHHTTVARRLDQLEVVLATRLVDRHPRGIRLTVAGERLAEHVRGIERGVAGAARAVEGGDLRLAGDVRLTVPPELLPVVLGALSGFRATAPDVRVLLDSTDALRDLGRREAHLALRAGAAPPDDAIAFEIAPIRWAVYRHPRAVTDAWIGIEGPARAAAERLMGEQEPAVVVSTVLAAAQAVQAGLGRCALPHFAAGPEMERVGDHVLVASHLWLLVHVDLRRVARVRALSTHLRAALSAALGGRCDDGPSEA